MIDAQYLQGLEGPPGRPSTKARCLVRSIEELEKLLGRYASRWRQRCLTWEDVLVKSREYDELAWEQERRGSESESLVLKYQEQPGFSV